MSYTFNNNTILATTTTDASANKLFNYKINGVDAIFLKPFSGIIVSPYEVVYIDIPRFHANALNYYYNSALDLAFCPKYTLHTTSENNVSVPSGVTTMFVVCIGGGGGGGGGGVITGGEYNGGSGGSGGGGALNGWFVQSVGSTYNVTIGTDGAFGRPPGNSTVSEGRISTSGSSGNGSGGSNGSTTSFVYNGTTYSSNGGNGGGGGTNSSAVGGSGGTGGGTPTPFIWRDGIDGENGYRDNNINNITSGRNGRSGNHNTITDVNGSLYINKKIINIEKRKNASADETDPNYTYYQTEYGDGGRGGRGEASSNWAWAGYSGNPGCAIVFFYYNNISTSAPIVTTVTTSSTHTLNASTTSFKLIIVGGGGGGQAGVQYDGANLGACGGGGASGTSGVYFTKNIPSNKQLSITIGAGGLNGGRTGWDTTDSYQYPVAYPTSGGSTTVKWNSDSISIEAYGGNPAEGWSGSGAGAYGGLGGAVATNEPTVTGSGNVYSITNIYTAFSTIGVAGTAGSNESAGTSGVGGTGGTNSNLSDYLSANGPAITTLDTYGNGGNGGKGEASNRDNPDGASPGSSGSSGVVIIIEY